MSGGSVVSSSNLRAGDYLATSLDVVVSDNDNEFLDLIPVDAIEPLPGQGVRLEAGELYEESGRVVMVRQSHIRTEHAVDDLVPTLFLVHRDSVDGVEWVAGERVIVGDRRVYNGTEYECIQGHVTQEDWDPPSVPALWSVVSEPPTNEWQSGVSYDIGDLVTYDGTEYQCIQAHTSQVGWEPNTTPALWATA
jgi:hypothetical protein